jgi:hydroxymethylpyrimidine pyrophosphatase-like HAD family hydrolase
MITVSVVDIEALAKASESGVRVVLSIGRVVQAAQRFIVRY